MNLQKTTFALALLALMLEILRGPFPVSARAQYTQPDSNQFLMLTLSPGCPSSFSEVTSLSGKMLLATTIENGDVNTTGGSSTATPTGTNSSASFTPAGTVAAPTFTGSAGTVPAQTISWPAGVPTFSGSSGTTSAVSAGTPAGTNGTATVATTSGSLAGTSSGAFSKIGTASPGSSFTVPAETFTGSALATHTHTLTPAGTVAWPAGVPTNATASFTPAGTNSAPAFTGTLGTVPAETFSGSPMAINPPYVKVIPCYRNG